MDSSQQSELIPIARPRRCRVQQYRDMASIVFRSFDSTLANLP